MLRRKIMAILNLIAFLGMVTVNALANILPINGVNTGAISDSYPNLFVPTGMTFLIWGLIYLLLAIYIVYQLKESWRASKIEPTVVEHVGPLFFLSCCANIGWILAWHYGEVLYSLGIMAALFLFLLIIYIKLDIGKYHPAKNEVYLVEMPFSIYFGWISVALVANVTAYLVSINWDRFGIDEQWWTIGVIGVVTILALVMIAKRRDVFYGLVIDWALLGIFLKRNADIPKLEPLVYTLIGGMAIITIYMLYKVIRGDTYYV